MDNKLSAAIIVALVCALKCVSIHPGGAMLFVYLSVSVFRVCFAPSLWDFKDHDALRHGACAERESISRLFKIPIAGYMITNSD